jgi:hypothetical protein
MELHDMGRLALLLLLTTGVAACGSAGGSQAPSPPVAGFSLRAWTTQALPPQNAFRTPAPSLAIDGGVLITTGPVPAIYPGPLLPGLIGQPISEAGQRAIVAAAGEAGLLNGPTDLTGGTMPGAVTGHLVFVVDGVAREVIGDPNKQIVCITTPCEAAPGTPEAFGGFWGRLSDLRWLEAELGAPAAHVPQRLAVLLVEPHLDATLPPSFADWPLDGPMSAFGASLDVPAGTPPIRCGIVEGADLPGVLAAFGSANELTRWRDGTGAELGVVARPLFPGESDPCLG